MNKKEHLVWMDLEMTGLNVDVDVILEIATIITDNELNIVAEGPALIINQPHAALEVMDNWVRNQHTKTGLIDAVAKSSMTLAVAQEETLDFIKEYCPPRDGVLCGNSVWQDRAFLRKYMPRITDYLHYRLIDVSSVKELAIRWYPKSQFLKFEKPDNHRALEDVRGSIKELAHYRKYFFIPEK
jgi:oligoribonuclease